MGSDWDEYVFSEAVNINPKRNLEKGTVAPYIEMSSVLPDKRKPNEIKMKEYSYGGAKFKSEDTLLARITPCLENGKIALVPEISEEIGFGSTEFIVLSGKEGITDNLFVYYLARSYEVRDFAIKSMTGSSGRQRVPIDAFDHLVVKIPPLPDQQKIAEILGALDDKIELNYEMNKTLEEMAQAIFKNWFVDFEPFKDNLVYNEELGKEIPDGWEVVELEQICDINMGQSPPSSTYNESGEGLPFYQGVRDYGFRYVKPSIYCSSPKKIAEPEDILFSVRAPVGEINVAPEESCIGRGIASLRYKDGPNNFLLYLLKRIQKYWKNIYEGGGTVFGAVTKEDLKKFELVFPGSEIIENFNAIVKPLDDIIKINEYESNILANIRDLLLPKLLTGEIRVNADGKKEEKEKQLNEIVDNE